MKKIKAVIWVIILLVLDQVTKFLAKNGLQGNEPFVIIKNVFQLNYLENKGAAFGIFQNKIILFVVLTAIVLVIIGVIYCRIPEDKKYSPLRISLILLTAGALGNLIDRVMNSYVVDFFYFQLINFPIFNVADCYVTVSAALLLILCVFYYKDEDLAFLNLKKEK
jgi:lipoprotein signal peptidase